MQAILVTPMAATVAKGKRYKATGFESCVVTAHDYELEGEANAAYAAQQLLDNYNSRPGTHTRYAIADTGTLPNGAWCVLLRTLR